MAPSKLGMPPPSGSSLHILLVITTLRVCGAQANPLTPLSPLCTYGKQEWSPYSHTWVPFGSALRLVLVESLPQDLPFASGSPAAQPLAQAWMQLLDSARESVHVASYYWSLTGPDIGVNDSSSQLVGPWFCFPTVRPRLSQLPWC